MSRFKVFKPPRFHLLASRCCQATSSCCSLRCNLTPLVVGPTMYSSYHHLMPYIGTASQVSCHWVCLVLGCRTFMGSGRAPTPAGRGSLHRLPTVESVSLESRRFAVQQAQAQFRLRSLNLHLLRPRNRSRLLNYLPRHPRRPSQGFQSKSCSTTRLLESTVSMQMLFAS